MLGEHPRFEDVADKIRHGGVCPGVGFPSGASEGEALVIRQDRAGVSTPAADSGGAAVDRRRFGNRQGPAGVVRMEFDCEMWTLVGAGGIAAARWRTLPPREPTFAEFQLSARERAKSLGLNTQ
jgi:hypothetical protein